MQELQKTNEHGFLVNDKNDTDMVKIEQSRAIQEAQAPYIIAQRFPRDENAAYNRIINSCKRPFLAEQAVYAYPKGGSIVTGASIRLAEVLAQNWGHIDMGIREISQTNGVSIAEAFAIDIQTGCRKSITFHVTHERHSKNGKKKLTDPRDIYELVANQGARRLRACILAIIPGDICEAALEECKKTLSSGKEPIQDRVRKLITAFDEFGIKVQHIEKNLGHKLDSVIEADILKLRAIYKSIKDGIASRNDFFDLGLTGETSSPQADELNELIGSSKSTKGK